MVQEDNDKEKEKLLFYRIFVLGAFLAGGAVALIEIWPSDHLLALIVLATFIAMVLIYEMLVRGWPLAPTIGFCVVTYASAWAIYQKVGHNLPIDTDSEVYLIPGNEQFNSKPCKQPEGSIAFIAGTNEFWSDEEGRQIGIIILDNKPVVTMKKTERGLLFSVEMFNLERKLVAKISNNKSILLPKNFGYKIKDPNTITLYDDYDKEILYVKFVNKNTVFIRGVFTGPDGTTIVISNEQILPTIRLDGGSRENCFQDSEGFMFSHNEQRGG
jgi:hypothetical protein